MRSVNGDKGAKEDDQLLREETHTAEFADDVDLGRTRPRDDVHAGSTSVSPGHGGLLNFGRHSFPAELSLLSSPSPSIRALGCAPIHRHRPLACMHVTQRA